MQRLVFCSGKVAWDAIAARDARQVPAAIIRVEQLFPFPQEQLLEVLEPVPERQGAGVAPGGAREHGRRGATCSTSTHPIEDRGYTVRPVARVESGSPATGSATIHEQELADLLDETFADL